MINWLHRHFPAGKNYLVSQTEKEQINSLLTARLVTPLQQGRKHNLWGKVAEKLPFIGKKLGWVPNRIPGTFLTSTVELEIADALAAAASLVMPLDRHLELAAKLLDKLDLSYLSGQNPLSLSQGETKLTWLLTQWVKQPEYLIIGYLPTSLSSRRVQLVLDFIHDSSQQTRSNLTIILGFQRDHTKWCSSLFSHANWQVIPTLPHFETNQDE